MEKALTEDLARAASWDAGMRSMRKAGRKKWGRDDYNAAQAEFDRLWPLLGSLTDWPIKEGA